jgi:hypothetical protein
VYTFLGPCAYIHTYTLNTLKAEADLNNTNSVPTSQKAHYVSITKTNMLMLFRETVAVYCENHTKHTNTFCRKNSEVLDIETCGTYGHNHGEIF